MEQLNQEWWEDPFKRWIVGLLNDQFADAGNAVVLRLPRGYACGEYVALFAVEWTADEIAQYQKDRTLPRKLDDIGKEDAVAWLSVHDARGFAGRPIEITPDQRRLTDQRPSLYLFYMGEERGTQVVPSEHVNLVPIVGTNLVRFEIKPSYLYDHGPIGWWLLPTQAETVRLHGGAGGEGLGIKGLSIDSSFVR